MTLNHCPHKKLRCAIGAAALFLLLVSVPLSAQDYSVYGEITGTSTYHRVPDAATQNVLTGEVKIAANHRLSFQAGDFVAHHFLTIDQDGDYTHTVTEAYLNLFASPEVTISLGRQRINWGTGYTFAPTDSLHPETADPEVDMGFTGSSVLYTPGSNFTVSLALSLDDALGQVDREFYNGLKYAAYASLFTGATTIAPSIVYEPDRTFRPGLSLSSEILNTVIFAEAACEFLNQVVYPDLSGPPLTRTAAAWEPYPLLAAGVEKSFGNDIIDVNLLTEYYYNSAGYSGAEADALYADPTVLAGAGAGTGGNGGGAGLLRRHYASETVTVDIAGYVTAEGAVLVNLQDGSGAVEHSATVTALRGIDFKATGRWYFGKKGESEFGTFPLAAVLPGRATVELSATVHF